MKMIVVTYYEAVDDEVMGILSRIGADTYTKWTKVLGKGQSSGPHLATHVWPKANNVIAVCVEEDLAAELIADIRRLRETLRHEGVKAFVMPVEEVT